MLPLIPSAARHVRGEQHLRTLDCAYYQPEFVTPERSDPEDRERRHAGGHVVVVSRSTGAAIWIGTYEQSEGPSELLREQTTARRRGKGSSGTRMPTSYAEVINQLRRQGCRVEPQHRHYKIVTPDGYVRSIPKSTSDWRAVRNTVSMFRHIGIDLTRKDPSSRR